MVLRSTLEWLWNVLAEPVLPLIQAQDKRDGADSDSLPRVWWYPTGELTLLPVHAAGYHDGSRRAVIDLVVSSYMPKVRFRVQPSAQDTLRHNEAEKLLVVAMPSTPGHAPLPGVARELDIIHDLGIDLDLVTGAAASRAAVRSALGNYSWAHFTCHGGQDLLHPSRGGLLLSDGVLSIQEISTVAHRGGDFVFLAACKTAIGGVAVVDEVITLVSSLQFAGWQSIIGSLWSVGDSDAAHVVERVYSKMVKDGILDVDVAAYALHDAVREIRDSPDGEARPSRWTPFVHLGT